jgi:hypothetical protein
MKCISNKAAPSNPRWLPFLLEQEITGNIIDAQLIYFSFAFRLVLFV